MEALGLQKTIYNNGNGKIFYWIRRGEPCFVFIHGLLDSSSGFRKIIQNLPKEFGVLSIDLPGFARSPFPLEKIYYDLPVMAKTVADFLETIPEKKLVLVGHSMGGLVVQHIVAKYPSSKFRKIVLISSSSFPHPERDEMKSLLFPNTLKKIDILLGELYFQKPPELPIWVKFLLLQNWNSKPYRFLTENTLAHEEEVFFGNQSKKIKLPTLLLLGDFDRIVPKSLVQKLKRILKKSKLILIPNAKHAVHLERAEEVSKEILKFVQK